MTEEPYDAPVIHDKRRVDPVTGELRASESSADLADDSEVPADADERHVSVVQGDASVEEAVQEAEALAIERLEDLKRVQAEYVNYRRRVERDRETVRETAVANVLGELLSVLDDIGRAREHGDLTGAFRSVGESLEATVAKLGLVRYGEPGDGFDPTVHEALMHEYSDEVAEPTCIRILMPGYRYGERIIRPARVAVAEPTAALPADEPDAGGADSAPVAGDSPGDD